MAHAIIGSTRLRLTAAALGVFALALLLTYLGTSGARADSTQLARDPGGGSVSAVHPQATPEPEDTPPPPDCNKPYDKVFSAGHIALFDVYWDDENKVLVNNPCPPTVVHVPAQEGSGGSASAPARTDRYASNVNIASTIIHIPGDGVTARANNLDDYQKWPFLYPDATDGDDDGEEIDKASEVGAPSSTKVWTLPDCSHDATPAPTATDLCIGFSAGLLQADDWRDLDFEFESIREPGLTPAERGNVFVFYPSGGIPTGQEQVIWNTKNPDANEIVIDGGEYLHEPWLFTEPGRYEFAVHVKAHPNLANTSIDYIRTAKLETVTSQVVTYTFHVGPLAGLEVAIDADDDSNSTTVPSPAVGDTVTFTVKATNHGPNAAKAALVQINLPEGLSYSGNSSQTVTEINGTVAWAIGEMAKPTTSTSPTEMTLTFDATVDTGSGGLKLTTEAEIRDQEKTDLDDATQDNTDMVSITTAGTAQNRAPILEVSRQIHEMAKAGTAVGEPISMIDADMDELTYNLCGLGANAFDVGQNGQITVASSHDSFEQAAASALDYETKWSYHLRLDVSDSGADGDCDNTDVDYSVLVHITLEDVAHDGATLTLTSSTVDPQSGKATLMAHASGLPEDANHVQYRYSIKRPDNTAWYSEFGGTSHSVGPFYGETVKFLVDMEFRSGGRWHGLTSEEISITWPAS